MPASHERTATSIGSGPASFSLLCMLFTSHIWKSYLKKGEASMVAPFRGASARDGAFSDERRSVEHSPQAAAGEAHCHENRPGRPEKPRQNGGMYRGGRGN